MLARFLSRVCLSTRRLAQNLGWRLAAATMPAAPTPVVGTLADLVRSKPALIAKSALLRQ